ncbi:MAG: YabP/YqfC family sporulation protein [Clostridia bacterium]|nr:YabP/YqfC family sporulation protein [Clostridia bacterium]
MEGVYMEGVPHSVTIEDCKKITATAIDSVDGFSSTQIILSFSGGRIIISGSGLKIINFSRSGGSFAATGTVNGIRYAGKAVNLKQRLFK